MSEDVKLRQVGTRPVRPDGVDKVTGRASYGADLVLPGMLWGAVLRSPHPHARIRSIDASAALAMDGVRGVVSGADLPDISSEEAFVGEGPTNFRDLSRNVLARDKVLYHGHAVAAVAAVDRATALAALEAIAVDYEVLPYVLDLDAAVAPGAPLLDEALVTRGDDTATSPSNVAQRIEIGHGNPDVGFAEADIVVENEFTTQAVHQGYIEPHACVASAGQDGQVQIWCSSQGHFMVRAYTAKLLGLDLSQIRVTPAEIGGGFGGKTTVYLEPLAAALSQRCGRPVKMVMSREEVFRATGPTSGSRIHVKLGCTRDGRLVAADGTLYYEAGAFPGSSVQAGAMTMFSPYELEHVRAVGYDVLVNKPKVAAYRAPGAPMAAFAVETLIDELAEKLDIDPMDLRLRNAAKQGTRAAFGPRFKKIGCVETFEAVKAHPHYTAPLGENQGRGVAAGFWFNGGMQSSASLQVNEDGSVDLISGNPDIGGSRASLALMAAEELGIDYERISPIVADTNSIAFSDLTGGSRVTFATGMAVVEAAREVIAQCCARAAKLWEVEPERVVWRDGEARLEGDADAAPLTLAELVRGAARTGGPIAGHASLTARGVGVAFGAHICDVEVDPETGRVEVIRYTAVQDVGRAIHPSYVEGQMQGGAAQGIGWALNEEYVYGEDGVMQNAGFLDYRMPVTSDLPMIDTVIVEVANPAHPYGVRGVGEVPIVPPLAAVANAVHAATGVRFRDLPMSPPAVLAGIDAARGTDA
jgi:CO/xanthine dehydrogenase Mo-binding subunit